MDDNLNVLAERYKEICQIPGKIGGGEYDERVDSGEKYKVMKALGDHLGLPGTSAADILSKMGKPSEMTASLDQGATIQTMPGPVISGSEESTPVPFYLIYNLIPKKNYLYFKIDPVKETVITSDWRTSSEQ